MFGVMINSNPCGDAIYRCVGKDDLMKFLEISFDEAQALQEIHINFDYWWKGKDHIDCKKWTYDGDDVYSEFDLKNFFLANICDMYKGAKIMKNETTCKKIENIEGLKKWLHFGKTRITIKEMYFGIWKNGWSFN